MLEQKKEIYDMLPPAYYPVTRLCKPEVKIEDLRRLLAQKELCFPLIAKPDIGQRGLGVKLVNSETDLVEYIASSKVDFLIQEFIDYENEIGIFYYRIPGEANGCISGVVGKEFLTIKGDGYSTMENLLHREDRYTLQLPVLKATYGNLLKQVLALGECRNLVPYGNHSRGAKFTDMTGRVTTELIQAIDQVCQTIPEFYYGRLDIKFDTWEELCKGKNFSIIELNGAGSEPTHIYDPSHSIFFAWKEIIRHLRILYRISKMNAERTGTKFMSTRQGLKMLSDNRRYLNLLSS